MPTYVYECSLCGTSRDHYRKIADRFDKPDCEQCGGEACGELVIGRTNYHGERVVGDKRIIRDEREVIAERGERWRDEGTTGKEGGAGKKIYGHG